METYEIVILSIVGTIVVKLFILSIIIATKSSLVDFMEKTLGITLFAIDSIILLSAVITGTICAIARYLG